MAGRVEGKIALVVGGGQTPGETIGNGRATALVLAREGAKVAVFDREQARAAGDGRPDHCRGRRSLGRAAPTSRTRTP